MKRHALLVSVFVVGFGLGAVVPWVSAAPKVGDAKFENEFLKKFVPTPEKPLTLRISGADYQVVGTIEVQDDYVAFQLKGAGTLWAKIHDIAAITQ